MIKFRKTLFSSFVPFVVERDLPGLYASIFKVLGFKQDLPRTVAALYVAMRLGRLCQRKLPAQHHPDFSLGQQLNDGLHDAGNVLGPRATQGAEAESEHAAASPLQLV